MRPYRPDNDVELLNEAEIDAALNAALETPLNDLLSIEEFAEKTEAEAAEPAEVAELAAEDSETLPFESLPVTRAA